MFACHVSFLFSTRLFFFGTPSEKELTEFENKSNVVRF